MAYTSTDLDAIRAARLRGIRTVQLADRSVTYTSDSEMRQVERDITRELTGTAQRRKQFTAIGSKGLS